MKVIPQAKWIDFAHQIIHHGRALCTARAPKCAECPLETLCHAADKTWSTVEQHKLAKGKKRLGSRIGESGWSMKAASDLYFPDG